MKISGLQKLTLLDFPGKIAATVFCYGCNFRCPFCHNAALVTKGQQEELGTGEILSFLKKRQGILEGVCITGGEPTLYKDLPEFIEEIKKLGYLVKLDTNGYNPEMLARLLDSGNLDYVAMDIKNCPSRYGETAGVENFDYERIKQSIFLIEQGKTEYEFRTTVIKGYHDEAALSEICSMLKKESSYFLQQFKDSGDLISETTQGFDEKEMKQLRSLLVSKGFNPLLRGVS